jgi:hypothetical protein
MAEDCILQDHTPALGARAEHLRCWFLSGDCVPSHQCDERRRLSADEIALREQEDAA